MTRWITAQNLTYLNELVHAEPELYGIYLKDMRDGNYITDDANGNKILDPEGDYSGYYRDIQWKNKTITELYYPGSVFKVITAAMGVDSGKATYQHHPELLRCLRRCQGDLPLRRQRRPMASQNLADGPAEQLQHLLHPAGPAGRLQPLLRLLRRLRLHRADRRGPAQRDQLYAVLQRQPAGRSPARFLGLRSGHGGHAAAGLHRHFGSRQRRLPRHPPCGG